MDEISITISIAGRQYRLKSDEKEKEQIEEAARQINKLIRLYAENFAYKDNQDLLAMVSLQETLGLIRRDIEIREASEGIEKQITLIDRILSDNNGE
jgi:cell division protein ZapA (FtsZ GTPase activity inhibitor)